MRKLVYKQIGTKKEKRVFHHEAIYDENNELIQEAFDEEKEIDVPIMGTVYEDLTEKEIEDIESIPQMPTDAERIEALEMAMLEMLEVLANG